MSITIPGNLPDAIASEQAVIGCILLDPEAKADVEFLQPEHFTRTDHQAIWKAIKHLQVPDIANVWDLLKSQGQKIGISGPFQGLEYLEHLEGIPLGPSKIKALARTVFDVWLRRKAIENASKMIALAQDVNNDEYVEGIEDLAGELAAEDPARSGFRDWETINESVIERLDARRNGLIKTVKTGYTDLDALTGGFEKGMQYVVAARTHHGKTEFCLSITLSVASQGLKVAYFSPEMPGEALAQRLHQMKIGRSSQPFRDPAQSFPSEQEYQDFLSKLRSLVLPIHIDDYASITPFYVYNKVKRLQRDAPVDLVIVDRGNLMTMPGYEKDRTIATQLIGKTMKTNARLLDVPIIETGQLKREVENRKDKRGKLGDLLYGGEQDADVVFMLYREDMYDPTVALGLLEISIEKDRISGQLGTFSLYRSPLSGLLSNLQVRKVNLNP